MEESHNTFKKYFPRRKDQLTLLISIVASVAIAVILTGKLWKFGLLAGIATGVALPQMLTRLRINARRRKFNSQIIDAIMLITSCLKAGLSFNQAIDILCQEMPPPISEEFTIVLKSLRIGVSLEEAFMELSKRMPLEELNFMLSAILVARETGGDLPSVLMRLVNTLRDRIRLKENIRTYTMQGRMQAVIMAFIPVAFVFLVLQQNEHHFDIMFNTDLGKTLLILAAVLQVIAFFVIAKVSSIKI